MVASGRCSSRQATLVLDTRHSPSESWAPLESMLGLNRPDRWSVGGGKLSSRRESAIAYVAHALGWAPQPSSQPSGHQDHPPEMRKLPGFLCYTFSTSIDMPYLLMPCNVFRPNPALFSLALAPSCSHCKGIWSSWDKGLCWWGGHRAQRGGGDECSLGVCESPFYCLFNDWGELRCFSFSLFVFIAQTRGEEQV